MKKLITLMLLFIGFISYSGMTQELKLDEILSRYYEAMGIARVKEWKSLTANCKSSSQGMDFPITIITKRPGKIRIEVEIQGNKMIQAFDGQSGWSVSPWSGSTDPQDMTADEVKMMKEQADFDGVLVDWKEKGNKVELIGKEDLEGTPVYKIKIIRADENTEIYFLDAENFVPIKVSSVTKIQGNETESETYTSNYKDVSGAMMPFAIENKFKGRSGQGASQHVLIEKYEPNREVSDSLFVKPAKKN